MLIYVRKNSKKDMERPGSCKRGHEECWFLHTIPKWYRNSREIAKQMSEKRQRMKEKTRVIINKNAAPPVWQQDAQRNTLQTNGTPNVRGVVPSVPSFVSPFRTNQRPVNFDDDFLEVITKVVEETIKRHAEID